MCSMSGAYPSCGLPVVGAKVVLQVHSATSAFMLARVGSAASRIAPGYDHRRVLLTAWWPDLGGLSIGYARVAASLFMFTDGLIFTVAVNISTSVNVILWATHPDMRLSR